MVNILVFPCGSEIAMEIHRAFQGIRDVNLLGASSCADHGRFVFNPCFQLPSITEARCVSDINDFVREHSVDYIFPAHDSVIWKLSQCQMQCDIIGSIPETCDITRSKRKTYQNLAKFVRVPHQNVEDFPVFLKPDVGQGSKGTYIAYSREELDFYLSRDPSLLVLELLPGDEYTVDCFTDFDGNLRFCGPRKRNRINNGISVNTTNIRDKKLFLEMAATINAHLNLNGAWFFQTKESRTGELVLLEVAPRIGGSSGLNRAQGVNLPVLSYYNQRRIPIDILANDYNVELDRALSNKYRLNIEYEHVYVDFDDCLCMGGKLNPDVVRLLIESINEKKGVHLLSKHVGNLREQLKLLRIDGLFDTIVQIDRRDRKSDFIAHPNSIFIDDSFSERAEVQQALGIPCFSLDAIESLL